MDYCGEHTKTIEILGEIKGGQVAITGHLHTLNDRVNSVITSISDVAKDFPAWRERVLKLEVIVEQFVKHSREREQEMINRQTKLLTMLGLAIAAVNVAVSLFLKYHN
jgi:hypothetical protein